ncbi:MAG: STY0301 family protein [Dongiaceae bacterium]
MTKPIKTKPHLLSVTLLGLVLASLSGGATAVELVLCPESLKIADEVRAPAGWTATNGVNERAFLRISVLNMDSGGREYDLHPDDEEQNGPLLTQIWKLVDYRDLPIVLRCHYQDTVSTIEGELPATLTTCSQTFVHDPTNTSGEAMPSPATMECR